MALFLSSVIVFDRSSLDTSLTVGLIRRVTFSFEVQYKLKASSLPLLQVMGFKESHP